MASIIRRMKADAKAIMEKAYSAFNKRDIDGALALMTEDVSWPKASEGGRVVGKEGSRAYWSRQWGEFDPHVEPLAITEEDEGRIRVRVHQLVKSLEGMFFRTARFSTYSLRKENSSQPWISGMRPMRPVRLPHSNIDLNWPFIMRLSVISRTHNRSLGPIESMLCIQRNIRNSAGVAARSSLQENHHE